MKGNKISKIKGHHNIFTQISGWFNLTKVNVFFYKNNCIKPMKNSLSLKKWETDYIPFDGYDVLRDNILSEDGKVIRLLGLSGLGKSRLIYEIFSKEDNSNNYYCANSSDPRLTNDLNTLLGEKQDKSGYIVLDNCDTKSYQSILNLIQDTPTSYKLITIHNDPNELSNSNGVSVLHLRRVDLKGAVDNYINRSLEAMGCDNSSVSEQIRYMSDGFPQIAIKAIEEYRSQGATHLINDEVLWQKMCGNTINEKESKIALCSLAIFDPIGYKDEVKGDYAYVCNNENITPLYDKSPRYKEDVFSSVVRSMTKKELIEHISSWIYVRPLPLAVWLVGKWFENCDDERFGRVVGDLDSIEDHSQSERMKRAFCKRLEYMQDNKSAIEMYNRLMGDNGPFRNEKVVCSDFGSRLFLAISTVNPVAVASCLYYIVAGKSTEWLKTNIIKDARRNIVWCLEHLCFPKDSFDKAAWVLAKLALAENESWGNNSTGNFLQLFHVILPGTSANLQQRLDIMNELYLFGEEAIPLLIKTLDRAFDYGSFTRSGGGEKFGFKTLYDFTPNGLEIINYWNGCREIIQTLLQEYPNYINDLKKIALNHTYSLGPSSGCWDILFGILSDIYKANKGAWPEMSKELYTLKINGYKLSDSESEKLDSWIDAFSNHTYIEVLSNANYKFYNDDRYKDFDTRMDRIEEYWKTYVDNFISKKLYDNMDIIGQLMDYQEVDYTYGRLLSINLDEQQTNTLVSNIEKVINEKDNDYASIFVNIVLGNTKYENIFKSFCDFLLKTSHFATYFNILSPRETKELTLIDNILNVIKHYDLSVDKYLPIYLSRAPLYDVEQMYNTCKKIKDIYPDAGDVLLHYIYGRQYSENILKDSMRKITTSLILNYTPHESKLCSPRQVNSLADDVLRKTNDSDFAKKYNLKIIQAAGDYETYKRSESLYDNVYFNLLPKYQDDILEDVLNALSDENPLFWFFFHDELGSGTGMGSGPLFQCKINKIKEKTLKEKKNDLPERLAQMCPVFQYSKEKCGYDDKFSDFFYWLIDNFNDFTKQKEILDSFHANMGTYSWTGSVLPLLHREKKAFVALKDYTKNTTVLKWVDKSLSALDKEINREEKNEAYESLVY